MHFAINTHYIILDFLSNYKPFILRHHHMIELRRFTEILCSDGGLGSLREFRPRCRNFLQYTKYCCETAPNQNAKFTRKSLLSNHAVIPFSFTLFFFYPIFNVHKIGVSY